MPILDNFYEKNNIYFTIRFSTSFPFKKNVEGVKINRTGIWNYELSFSHDHYDLVGLLEETGFLKKVSMRKKEQKSCIFPDIFQIHFVSHFYNLFSNPTFPLVSNHPIYPDSFSVPKHLLIGSFQQLKERIPNLQFSTFLYTMNVYVFMMENCKKTCKIQMVYHLPDVEGKNKIFSDIVCIQVDCVDFETIANVIQRKRLSRFRVGEIYGKYNFLSNYVSEEIKTIPTFDITFSNLPNPLSFYDVSIKKKSVQFENIYLQFLCNHTENVFFCFALTESFKNFSKSLFEYINEFIYDRSKTFER